MEFSKQLQKSNKKVNELMKRVKKHEVRNEGNTSAARHAMALPEFIEIVKRCRKMPGYHFGWYTGAKYLFLLSQFKHVINHSSKSKFHSEQEDEISPLSTLSTKLETLFLFSSLEICISCKYWSSTFPCF